MKELSHLYWSQELEPYDEMNRVQMEITLMYSSRKRKTLFSRDGHFIFLKRNKKSSTPFLKSLSYNIKLNEVIMVSISGVFSI